MEAKAQIYMGRRRIRKVVEMEGGEEYLRLNTKDKVLQEPSNRDDREILLNVKHVKFVKVAMEPRGAWLPVSINESVEGCEHSKN